MLHGANGTPVGHLATPSVTQDPPISDAKKITPPVIDVTSDFPSAAPPAPFASYFSLNVPTVPATPASRSSLGDRPPLAPIIVNQFPIRAAPPIPMRDSDLRQVPLIDLDLDLDLRQPPMMTRDKDVRHFPMGDQDFRSLNAAPGLPFNEPSFQNVPITDLVPNSRLFFDKPRPELLSDANRIENRRVDASSPCMEYLRTADILPLQNIPPGHMTPQKSPRMAPSRISSESPLGVVSPNTVSSPYPGNNSIVTSAAASVPPSYDQEKER